MSAPLKQLTIGHLRGAVTPFSLPFEKGKTLSILYGENGTGKSTICDAFELLGKGKVGSLEDRGLGQTPQYWPTVGKQRSDVSVTIETADGAKCHATVGKGNEVIAQPANGRPRVEVLRRRQILSLIEARPADRYEEIRRFIDVSGVEASEGTLRDLIRGLTSSRETAVARIDENRNTILQFWETAGKPGADPLAWAESERQRDMTASSAEARALAALRSAHTRLPQIPGRIAAATGAIRAAQESDSAATKETEKVLQIVSRDAGEVVQILRAAQTYLAKNPSPPACPLCESSEKTADLANRIAKRLETFSSLQAAQTQQRTASESVQRARTQLETVHEQAVADITEFEKCLASSELPKDIARPTSPIPSDPANLPSWLSATETLPVEWQKAEAARYEKKQLKETLAKALDTLRVNTQAQKDLDVLLPRLKKTLEIAEEQRRLFTDGILAQIATEVGRIYEIVHPGEGLNKISLQLDPNKRSSLDIGASFGSLSGTPPQAYFSDSHLDTLGLCVFLALSALEQPKDTILVLDDVLASVDEPHVERLIEMLYSEALKFRHTMITTHYRPWKEKLRWGWLRTGQCQFIELTKWTATNGLTLVRSISDVERLRELLAETPPDPQLVCSKAGVVLEAALDFLTLLYECKVPRRAGKAYTLGDLLPAIDAKLRQALRVDVLTGAGASGVSTYKTVNLAPTLEELTRIAQARNVFGCHFNDLSFQLLESDGLGFGQQVLLLMETLTDKEACWPRNGRSGEYWATAGETRKLHPFKRPT